MEIRWGGQLAEADLRGALRLHFKVRRAVWVWCIVMAVMLAAALLVQAVVAIFDPEHGFFTLVMLWPVLIPLAIFVSPVVVPTCLPQLLAGRTFRANPALQHPVTGTATPEGLRIETVHSREEMAWGVFQQYRRSRELVLVYPNAAMFHAFPRRFFASDGDWQAFNELVATHVRLAGKPGTPGTTFRRYLQRGFVALLVVVAIVALLVTLLTPEGR